MLAPLAQDPGRAQTACLCTDVLDYLLQHHLGGIAQVNAGVAANPRRSYCCAFHRALCDGPGWGDGASLH